MRRYKLTVSETPQNERNFTPSPDDSAIMYFSAASAVYAEQRALELFHLLAVDPKNCYYSVEEV